MVNKYINQAEEGIWATSIYVIFSLLAIDAILTFVLLYQATSAAACLEGYKALIRLMIRRLSISTDIHPYMSYKNTTCQQS